MTDQAETVIQIDKDTRHRPRTVLATLPSDAHTWNLVFLELFLQEHGHDVVNLGPCTPTDLVLRTVTDCHPDLVVVSSVNGHGARDAVILGARLRANAVRPAHVVIGGKLGVDGVLSPDTMQELVTAGYDAVLSDDAGAQGLGRILELALDGRGDTGA